MPSEHELFFRKLDEKGEDAVRLELASHIYNEQRSKLAEEWLAMKERSREESAAGRQRKNEDETIALARLTLEAARESNRIAADNLRSTQISVQAAEKQARWAVWAAVVAVVAAIVSAHEFLLALIDQVLH